MDSTIGDNASDVFEFFIDNTAYFFHREQVKNSIKMSNMSDNEKERRLKEINNLSGFAECFMFMKLAGSCLQGTGVASGNRPMLAAGTVVKYIGEELLERNIAGVEKRAYSTEQEEGPEIFTDVEIKAGETYQFTIKNGVYNFNCESNGVIYDKASYSPYGGANAWYAEKMAPGKGSFMCIGNLVCITVKRGILKIKNLSNKKVTYKRGKQEAITKVVLNAGSTFECKGHKKKKLCRLRTI